MDVHGGDVEQQGGAARDRGEDRGQRRSAAATVRAASRSANRPASGSRPDHRPARPTIAGLVMMSPIWASAAPPAMSAATAAVLPPLSGFSPVLCATARALPSAAQPTPRATTTSPIERHLAGGTHLAASPGQRGDRVLPGGGPRGQHCCEHAGADPDQRDREQLERPDVEPAEVGGCDFGSTGRATAASTRPSSTPRRHRQRRAPARRRAPPRGRAGVTRRSLPAARGTAPVGGHRRRRPRRRAGRPPASTRPRPPPRASEEPVAVRRPQCRRRLRTSGTAESGGGSSSTWRDVTSRPSPVQHVHVGPGHRAGHRRARSWAPVAGVLAPSSAPGSAEEPLARGAPRPGPRRRSASPSARGWLSRTVPPTLTPSW